MDTLVPVLQNGLCVDCPASAPRCSPSAPWRAAKRCDHSRGASYFLGPVQGEGGAAEAGGGSARRYAGARSASALALGIGHDA
jgi:hypothetical protein